MTTFNYHSNLFKKKQIVRQHKYSSINEYFDKIYVICSPKDTEQKKLLSSYYGKYNIDFDFWDAVDGFKDKQLKKIYKNYVERSLDDPLTDQTEKSLNRKLIKSPGALGLLKTYQQIFENSIDKSYKNILVFENDILFDKDWQEKLLLFINNYINYDILYLGASHHLWNNPDILNINHTNISVAYYKAPSRIDGSFATAYSSNIYKELLNYINKFNAPIDLYLRYINQKNNSYVIYPNIVIAETTKPSTISGLSRNLRYHCKKVRWDLSKIDFSRAILKTSILIANYNSTDTIQQLLNSIKIQSYPNTETIIVDDCSTDRCVSIIKKWIKNNKNINIKLIELNKNVGAYRCRNIALENSTGFFITQLDSDDIFLPNKIENDIYNYFNFSQYDLLFSLMYRSQNIDYKYFYDYYLLNDQINLERSQNRKSFYNTENTDYDWNFRFRFGLPTLFVEKEFFQKYGKWRDDYRYGMDIELIQRYVIKKYNTFIDYKNLYMLITKNNAQNLGIFCDNKMNYVSFPMNNNNATNICNQTEREKIHQICENDLKKLLTSAVTNATIQAE